MDKRLLYVLPLCFAIVLGWSVLSQKMGWTPPPEQRASAPAQPVSEPAPSPNAPAASGAGAPAPAPAATDPALGPVIGDEVERTETIVVGSRGTPGHYRAVFTNKGAALVELRTGNFFDQAGRSAEEQRDPAHWAVLVGEQHSPEQSRAMSLRATLSSQSLVKEPLERALWKMTPLGPETAREGVEFELAPGTGVTFVKRFLFVPGSDEIRFEFELRNGSVQELTGFRSFLLTPAAGVPNNSGDAFYTEPQAVAATKPPDSSEPALVVQHIDVGGQHRSDVFRGTPPLLFAGVQNKYFAVLVRAADDLSRPALTAASWRLLRDEAYAAAHPQNSNEAWRQLETDVDLQVTLPPPGATRAWNFLLYAGPKQDEALEAAHPAYVSLVTEDLGFTSGIARILLGVLGFFHSMTNSWGMAIVLMTLLVRVVLFPVNRRSQTAMGRYQAKMKRLQPRIEELKKRFAGDPSKLRAEQAKLMQTEGAFPPLGGCLPPLLQLPIFIGLFRAVGVSFDLRQAPFLGVIQDLSLPDRLIPVDITLPLLGHMTAINVLPPLMVVFWILQQRSMPKPTEEQALMMYKMMMFMPIVMGIFLYNYAAGLSIYMITTSVLGIFEQKVIRKYWPVDDTELPVKKKKGGFMAKLMEAQEQRMKQLEQAKRMQGGRKAKSR